MSKTTEYHCGLLRGFLLAYKANAEALESLDALAGTAPKPKREAIDRDIGDNFRLPQQVKQEPKPSAELIAEADSDAKRNSRWNDSDDQTMRTMLSEGSSVADASRELGRTIAACYTRMNTLKNLAKNHAAA